MKQGFRLISGCYRSSLLPHLENIEASRIGIVTGKFDVLIVPNQKNDLINNRNV